MKKTLITSSESLQVLGNTKTELSKLSLSLKKKKIIKPSSNANYEDLLVGEYQFIENGVVIANTLQDFDNVNISGYEHKISGGIFLHRLPSHCTDNSNPAEIKVELFIKHPTQEDTEGRLILRYVNDNGVEKLEACIYDNTTMGDISDARIDIPNGYYVFVKQ